MEKSHFVRSLAVLACMLGVSTGLCLANPFVAEAGWASNDSGTSGSWSKSDSGSTGSSWSSSNSNSSSNSGGTSWASSNSGNTHQQSHISMPDPLTQISSGTLRGIIKQCRGKVVLLNFFASWCGPCRQEIPSLKALRNKFSEDDLVIISVSVDENRANLEAMRNEVQFNYPTLWASTELTQAYNIQSIPRIIIYDRDGYTVTDDTGMVEQSALFNFMEAIVKY